MDLSKSYVLELSRVWECLLRDAAQAYPDLESEFERDLVRLHALVKARGLPFYMVDLPAVGKHLDRCLSTGQYISSGLPATRRVSRKVAVPQFLRGLYLLVFNECGSLRADCDVSAVALLRQLLLFAKKATVACSDEAVTLEMRDFLAIDRSLSSPPRGWSGDDPGEIVGCHLFRDDDLYTVRLRGQHGYHPMMVDLTTNLDKVVRFVCSELGVYDPEHWGFKHGPGAVAERVGAGVNKYHFVNWSRRLERVFPYADCAFHNYAAWAEASEKGECTSQEACSRLIAVPKTVDKPRLIAAEPTEHQWCQQNIWRYFDVRVADSLLSQFLTFRSQELNQKLCLESSASGKLATLDLSSASDRVTCRVVQCMFWRLPSLLMALHASRTRYVEVPLDGGFCQSLNKFATMGSACTFPVESLIFLTVALASAVTIRRLPVTKEALKSLVGEVAVFGDDIIVPQDTRELCVSALDFLEFKVNAKKSFSEGNFRESCGVDAFRGTMVTPTYWRGPNTGRPESVASTVQVHNNLLSKGLWVTARHLASTVRKHHCAYVSADSGVFGLKTHVMPRPETLYKSRWNESLHRFEVLVPQLIVAVRKTPIEDDSALLQYFTEDPAPTTKWRGGIASRPLLKIRQRWVARDSISAQRC